MYIIAPQFIRDYIQENFNDCGKLSANGHEFIMESVFLSNDWKKHMSINVDSGLWQCFKTGRSGNFVSLYAHVKNMPYFKAQRELIIKNFEFQDLPIPEIDRTTKEQAELDTSELEPITLNSGYSSDPLMLEAWNFLFGRKLFVTDYEETSSFYLCRKGKFKNRIIIPFKSEGVVYYFQGRAIYDAKPKYLNPGTDTAPKPSDILYPYDEDSDLLVISEGPLDARSLQLQGVNATCTMGSSVSPRQAEILSLFNGKIILGYDNDKAGRRGIKKFDRLRRERRIESFDICNPPSEFKDWNEAHVADLNLFDWVMEKSVPYDFEYKISTQLDSEQM